jgi:hypothetical protein
MVSIGSELAEDRAASRAAALVPEFSRVRDKPADNRQGNACSEQRREL